MRILHLFREYAEARNATRGRRLYAYASAGLPIAVLSWVLLSGAPVWVFWVVVISEAFLDTLLVRRWMNHDAVSRAREAEL